MTFLTSKHTFEAHYRHLIYFSVTGYGPKNLFSPNKYVVRRSLHKFRTVVTTELVSINESGNEQPGKVERCRTSVEGESLEKGAVASRTGGETGITREPLKNSKVST